MEELKKKTIILTLSEKCNLNCVYCYEHDKDHDSMDIGVAKEAIRDTFNNAEDYDEIVINFHGGEPFAVFPLLKDICEWVWAQKWNKPYICFATTNGTLVHGEIKDWLIKNKTRCVAGLSIDGTKEMHDINRNNSFDSIDIKFFRENWPTQGIKMTISPQTLPNLAQGIMFIHSLEFEVNSNLAYGIDWSDKMLQKIFAEQLKLLADYYIDNPDIKPSSLFNMRMPMVGELNKQVFPKWCGTGEHMLNISPEGKKYPCQAFMPSVQHENKQEMDFREIVKNSNFIDEKCIDCPVLFQCPTCYGMNYYSFGDIALRPKDLCEMTKIRALSNSYLYGMMLQTPEKYKALNLTNINSIARGIEIIQNSFMDIMSQIDV